MKQTPIVFLGDNPTLQSGLARILRDIAVRTSALHEFRVAVMGRMGTSTRHLPFTVYPFPESEQWGEGVIEDVWQDFAGDQRGVVLTIWDPTRLSWLAMPQHLPDCSLRRFLLSKPFDLWGYVPVDARGPSGGLSTLGASVVQGYDRILAYSRFGADVLAKSIGREVDWAPHGLDLSIFKPYPREDGRALLSSRSGDAFRFFDGDVLVGCVAINQSRKDWGLVAQVCASLKTQYGRRFKAWWHTDVLERSHAYNFNALAADFGLGNQLLITTGAGWTDKDMALGYSACNLTLAAGMEGFGYPIVESMACGVPVITGDGHGGTELVTGAGGIVVEAAGDRIGGMASANVVRSVHSPQSWVGAAVELIEQPRDPQAVRERVAHLDWNGTLWKGVWKKWILGGLK